MDEKLKRVIELANQLQKAVDDCGGEVIGVIIDPAKSVVKSHIHVEDITSFDGIVFNRVTPADKYIEAPMTWYHTDAFGVRVIGAVSERSSK